MCIMPPFELFSQSSVSLYRSKLFPERDDDSRHAEDANGDNVSQLGQKMTVKTAGGKGGEMKDEKFTSIQ